MKARSKKRLSGDNEAWMRLYESWRWEIRVQAEQSLLALVDEAHRGNEKLRGWAQELAPFTPSFLATPELMPRGLSFAWTRSLVDMPHHKVTKEEREATAKALIDALETFIATAQKLLEAAAILPEPPPFELPPSETHPEWANRPAPEVTETMLQMSGKKREELTEQDKIILAQIERDHRSHLKTPRPFARPVAQGEPA